MTRYYIGTFMQSLKAAFIGPQLLAFAPATFLIAYWYGFDAAVVFVVSVMVVLLGLVRLLGAPRTESPAKLPVDSVTGLYLRKAAIQHLEETFHLDQARERRPVALAVEIDDFEDLKREHGDALGDHLLRITAERLKGALRAGDTLVRLDGGRFCIAMEATERVDLESCVQIAARLQSGVAEPITNNGMRLYLTASIGFFAPRRATERIAEFCLDAAEQALEDARANGRGSIRAYAKHNRRKRITRSGLVEDVQSALEGNQIMPWFQPQLSTDTGDVSGVEALARWHHPVHGVILPGAFLPAVSGAGLTSRLGQVVLRQALSALSEWDAEDLYVPSVGVNFSSEDLSDPKLVDKIRWELDCFNLAPERLTVEILETVVAANAKDIITRNIGEIAKLGCKIDLDDFGTGHASIANVRRFFVNRIKIDRTFVSKVDSDRQQQEMLTAILELANRLNIDTLAEGVETREEHALLSQLGCKHVQGYHIAKAMPAVEMTQWLAQHRMTQSELPVLPKKSGT